jgi:hypothetical protein
MNTYQIACSGSSNKAKSDGCLGLKTGLAPLGVPATLGCIVRVPDTGLGLGFTIGDIGDAVKPALDDAAFRAAVVSRLRLTANGITFLL